MIQFDQFQRLPIKIILGSLLALQVIAITLNYSLDFDHYISIVVIFLACPIAYFTYHYLTITLRQVKTFEAIGRQQTVAFDNAHTNNEVDKLVTSQEYKQFREKQFIKLTGKNGGQAQPQINSQNPPPPSEKQQEIQKILQELEEAQTEIFDF